MQLIKNNFFITADADVNKTIKGPNGEQLYLDIDFNPFSYSTRTGTVAHTPYYCDINHGLKPGDEVLFHHSVVRKENKVTIGHDIFWNTTFFHIFATINKAILKPIGDFMFVEPIIDSELEKKGMQIKLREEAVIKKGIIRYMSEQVIKSGLKVGDTVQFTKNANYKVKVGDKVLYRMRVRNIRLAERDGEAILLDGDILLKDKKKVIKVSNSVGDIKVGETVAYFGRIEPEVKIKGLDYMVIRETDILYTI